MANISTTRRTFLGASAVLAGTALVACGSSSTDEAATDTAETTEAEATDTETTDTAAAGAGITGTYAIHVQGYDWGCGVDKVTLTLDEAIETVAAEDFAITETKQATDFTDDTFPVVEVTVDRQVTAATLGEDGKTIELELYCSPSDGSPLLYTMSTGYNTWSDPYYLTFAAAEGSSLALNIAQDYTEMTTSADEWALDSYAAADGTTYQYASWDPEEASTNLVVWLHGAGEGGTEATDPRITILANKVVALSEDDFQQTVGGAHVVAPQSPTMWMDQDGNQTYISEDATEVTSIYTESLEEFIDAYAEKVGADKIFLCGCSNGGFMTLWMGLDRPDKYVGIAPICEAIPDGAISDEQIEGIKDLPMYFVWSDDDTTVDPTTHEIPTTERLKEAGAATLHISTTEHVVDTSGQFFAVDENGEQTDQPYEYSGHWSWIYFDNNECECDEDGMKAFDFIAECFA